MDTTVPKSPDIPEPEIGQRVRHASGWTGRVRAYSQADRAVQVQWDDPTSEPTADADGCSWHHATWLTAISDEPDAPSPLVVYVIEQRTNLAAGGHAFQLLTAGFAYPSIPNAKAAVEYMAGAMVWNDRLEASQPGDRLPLYRIVEVPLATRGGAR